MLSSDKDPILHMHSYHCALCTVHSAIVSVVLYHITQDRKI